MLEIKIVKFKDSNIHIIDTIKTYIIVQRNHINKLKKYNNTRPIKWIPNQEIQKI